jgi:thiol-disulfide isomerase/thioredoxin
VQPKWIGLQISASAALPGAGSFPIDVSLSMQRSGLALLATFALLLPMTALIAQDQTADEEPTTPAEVKALYTPPAQNDAASIKAWVEKASQTPAPDRTPAGLREHFGKLEQAADAVIASPGVTEEGVIEAVRLKAGANSLMEQLGDTDAPQRREQFVTKLKVDPRPAIAVHGRLLDLEMAINKLQPGDDQGAQQVIDQVAALLQEKPLTDAHVSVAYSAAEAVESNAGDKLATTAYNLFAKYLKASADPRHVGVGETFEGAARRLNLVGNAVKIAGKTLDGKDFDLAEYKGKIVLVDFWATWCGPCLEELPNIKAMYEKHHDAGLEVVGVNLDDNLGRVGAFVSTQGLEWPQLVSDAGQEHPIANYYGVYQIPSTFIIGRDGKVTATDLFGDDLKGELERLLAEGT